MKNGSKRGPSLRRHKRSGNGYAKFNGRQVWFGPFDDPETHCRFAAFKAQWEASGRRLPIDDPDENFTVANLVARYLEHAEVYYRRADGETTGTVEAIGYAVRPLLSLFATTPAASFSIHALKLVRERMIQDGLARSTVNNRISRIVQVFHWGAEEDMCPLMRFGSELKAPDATDARKERATNGRAKKWFSRDQIRSTIDAAGPELKAAILLGCNCGVLPACRRTRCSRCDSERLRGDDGGASAAIPTQVLDSHRARGYLAAARTFFSAG